MAAEPPPPKPSASGIAGLLGQLLAYIDAPWKAGAVVVLLFVGVAAWTGYEHRDEIVEAWLTPSSARLKSADVPQALDRLADETGVDLVQIWSVDLNANSQRFVAARRKDGERPVIPSPRRLPIIVNTSDVKALVEVLNGTPVCASVTPQRASPVLRRLSERGMKHACGIPIPPSPEAFVGVIYLAWLTPPDAAAEDVAVGAAREIAGQLASR